MNQPDTARLLHRNPARPYAVAEVTEDGPEVFGALITEPEALAKDDQDVISLRARSAFAEARQVEMGRRDRRQWIERLRRAEQRAETKQIDVFRHQAAIRREILAIERLVEDAA
jgi:hypothetical protein